MPGVTHASGISMLPIAPPATTDRCAAPIRPIHNDGVPVTEFRIVMDRYFETMGIPIIAGRSLDARDRSTTVACRRRE